MLPKRPTRAIKIVDPNARPTPADPLPAPPMPPPPTARPQHNSSYQHLKSIIEGMNLAHLPTTEHNFQSHFIAHHHCEAPPMTQPDPLTHTLTQIFLPPKHDTSTCLSRFATFHDTITSSEWAIAAAWKTHTFQTSHTLKTICIHRGVDFAVSLAMKRWIQQHLGLLLEDLFPSMYHPHPGAYRGRNMHVNRNNVYNPQRGPQNISIPQQRLDLAASLPVPRRPPRIPERAEPVLVPNPSGRKTPPHKRSPKKNKLFAEERNRSRSGSVRGRKAVSIEDGSDGGQLLAKALPNGKKQVVPNTVDTTSVFCDTRISAWRRPNVESPWEINTTYSEERYGGFGATVPENDVGGLVVDATNGNQLAGENQIPGNSEDSLMATNQTLNQSLFRGRSIDKLLRTTKTADGQLAKGKQRAHRNQDLNSMEESSSDSSQDSGKGKAPAAPELVLRGGSGHINNLQLGEKSTRGSPGTGSLELDYVEVASKPVADFENSTTPIADKYSKGQAPSYNMVPAMPNMDFTVVVADTGEKANTPEFPVIIEENLAPVCPPMLPVSPPDYAGALTGSKGKSTDKPVSDHALPTSSNWKPSTVSAVPTETITTPIEPATYFPLARLAPTKSSVPVVPISPSSGKSWSSIVTGHTTDPSTTNRALPQNIVEIEGFPELGKPLNTLPSNQLPITKSIVKKKISLSAMAKPFEPAALRHAVSMESYLRTNNYTVPLEPPAITMHSPPKVPQFPMPTLPNDMPIPQAPTEYINFGFDILLEKVYSTPQFAQHLNGSYNELLFMENYLRAQYQRISIVFEDEWNYISVSQRKAVVAKALANLSERVDKVQFGEVEGVDDMLCDLGLAKPLPPNTPTVPVLCRTTSSNLRDAYVQGDFAEEKGKEKEKEKESSKFSKTAYLKWRAEYCFDLDADAFAITPDWLFGIIAWLLGKPHPRRHRFGPGCPRKRFGSSASGNGEPESTFIDPGFWCPDDCSECAESEEMGWSTERIFFRGSTRTAEKYNYSSVPNSPMMERFLDELEAPDGYFPATVLGSPGSEISTVIPPSEGHDSFVHPKLSILTAPRFISNRFSDPIFRSQERSDEWKANNPGRVKFMEMVNIDIALFYCNLIEEILKIFGEVRRERVWFKLPTIIDYYDALSWRSTAQSERGRPRARSEGEGNSRIRSTAAQKHKEAVDTKNKRAMVCQCVAEEQERVQAFVKETQRSVDWLVSGLKLVERDTDNEIGRAHDGGLWSVPVPPERDPLEEEFAELHIWRE